MIEHFKKFDEGGKSLLPLSFSHINEFAFQRDRWALKRIFGYEFPSSAAADSPATKEMSPPSVTPLPTSRRWCCPASLDPRVQAPWVAIFVRNGDGGATKKRHVYIANAATHRLTQNNRVWLKHHKRVKI